MRVQINGEAREIPERLSLQELIAHLKLPGERLAIELNRNVVRRAEWSTTGLNPDDKIEVVHFVGGGESRGRNASM